MERTGAYSKLLIVKVGQRRMGAIMRMQICVIAGRGVAIRQELIYSTLDGGAVHDRVPAMRPAEVP